MSSAEEIKKAVWACESSKAPGYDGFNFGVLKNMWDTMGDDLTNLVLTFFKSGTMPRSINTTWVALIPKVDGVAELSEYRPISMIGSIYKVISKVLASRLRNVMPSLVGETQTAFVRVQWWVKA